MERDKLERYLIDGLSLARIGEIEGKDPSTVAYWLKKHGLAAVHSLRHRARGGIDEPVLRDLVARGLSTREIAGELDRSQAT